MKKIKILLLLTLLPIVGCTSEIDSVEELSSKPSPVLASQMLSEEEALDRANQWMDNFFGETRADRKVADIEAISLLPGM